MDDLVELHLLNPFTGAESCLPSITTFSLIEGVERDPDNNGITGYRIKEVDSDTPYFCDLEHMRKYFFFKVVYFPSESIVVAIHGVYHEISFARLGDESWTEIKSPEPFFWDVILDKGERRFYAVTCVGFILALDLLGDSSTPPKISFIGPDSTMFDTQKHYLVKTTDGPDLLHVCRGRIHVPWDSVHDASIPSDEFETVRKTASFKIFRLDPSGLQWVEVKSLGETALFIGNNHSMSISTKDCPELKGNHIYFTEDDCSQYMVAPHARRDMGVYNLEDGSVVPLFPHDSLLARLTWPPPIWITPALS